MKIYRILANAIFVLHWSWVAFLIGISIVSLYFPWYRPIFAAAVIATVLSQIIWLGCPLMEVEYIFRRKYNPSETYKPSFVCYYLKKWFSINVHPALITAQLVAMLAVSLYLCIK